MSMATGPHEEIIAQWMLATANNGGVSRFDDLHVDDIDAGWKGREKWIEAGLASLRIAICARNLNKLTFVVGLGFSLESRDQPSGVDFHSREEFRGKIDCSPPSLYLFRRGEEPSAQTGCIVQQIDPSIVGATGDLHCYFLEFRQQDENEYCRSVFVEG